MARVAGTNLPSKKRIEYGLTYVHGIGLKFSRDILNKLKLDYNMRVKDLNDADIAAIDKEIAGNYVTEGALRKEVTLNIKRLQEIGSYRGSRHKAGLPVRGQRTKTNARTRKGPKKKGGSIALKRKITKK